MLFTRRRLFSTIRLYQLFVRMPDPTIRTVNRFSYHHNSSNMSVADLDRELVQRCLEKQPRSWEDFVDRFLGLVLHVIDHTASKREISLNPSERNTLCENVFDALGHGDFRLLRQFNEQGSLTTYLCVVVRRIVVRVFMNQSRVGRVRRAFDNAA